LTTNGPSDLDTDLARLFRAESGRLLALLVKQCRDLQLAEDALQEAFLSASRQWVSNQRPRNAVAWLLTVARRRMLDGLRKSTKLEDQALLQQLDLELTPTLSNEANYTIPDERLRLIFTCCHPALKQEAQIALTLKTLCGLNSKEIARAFLTSEVTLNQRLVRAKQKIKRARIPYQVPTQENLKERLVSVLAVLYLIYNESYSAYEGQTLSREELALEAIRLTRTLHALLPRPDVAGLLALMLLHQSRNQSRSDEKRSFITLEQQNRDLWDTTMIAEGTALLLSALAKGMPDQYQIQASISAVHAQAPSWEETDWPQIVLLYAELYRVAPSPIVQLNGLLALGHNGELTQAIDGVNKLEKELNSYQPFFAARADIYQRLGDLERAKHDYQQAISLTRNGAERDYLLMRMPE